MKVIDLDSRRKKKSKPKEPFCIQHLEWVEYVLKRNFPKAALLRVMTVCRERLKELNGVEER